MTTKRSKPWVDFLHPGWVVFSLALVVGWLAWWGSGGLEPRAFRPVARFAGYLAAATMLVPYLHIVRRLSRNRPWGAMRRWLHWHIGAAYAAGFFLLLHCQAQAHSWFTVTLLTLFWIVMLSGVAGFYGQKVLYRLLPLAVEQEIGLERLGPERDLLYQTAAASLEDYAVFTAGDVRDWRELIAQCTTRGTLLYGLVGRRLSGKADKEALAKLTADATDPKARTTLLDGINKLLRAPEFLDNAELLLDEDVTDWPKLVSALITPGPAAKQLGPRLTKDATDALAKLADPKTAADPKSRTTLLKALNEVLTGPGLTATLKVPSVRHQRAAVQKLLSECLADPPRLPEIATKPSPTTAPPTNRDAIIHHRHVVEAAAPTAFSRQPQPLEHFCADVLRDYLGRPFPSWTWLFSREFLEPVSSNALTRARLLSDEKGAAVVSRLERLVERRRQLDVEYWYHRLGRSWLLLHGPASVALFVLSVDHIWMSVWFGGW